jgi:hypothetical protein
VGSAEQPLALRVHVIAPGGASAGAAEPSPFYRRWWFWALVGGAAAGGGAAAFLATRGSGTGALDLHVQVVP